MGVPSFSRLMYTYVKDVHVCAELYIYMYVSVICNELWLCRLTTASCCDVIVGVVLRAYHVIP